MIFLATNLTGYCFIVIVTNMHLQSSQICRIQFLNRFSYKYNPDLLQHQLSTKNTPRYHGIGWTLIIPSLAVASIKPCADPGLTLVPQTHTPESWGTYLS